MQYYQFLLKHNLSEIETDLLTDDLGSWGFESFEQEDRIIKAYIPQNLYQEDLLERIQSTFLLENVEVELMPDKNWNEVWESSYSPVLFGDFCYVHAPFHPKMERVEYDIVIEPKMSFGTAHHPTTALIIGYLQENPPRGLDVLDMGCGTAVLAILAKKQGANHVLAVDNDSWAYENSLENAGKNAVDIEVVLGDAQSIQGRKFDVVIANINRNILMRDIEKYAETLSKGGVLYLSGFYLQDMGLLEEECNKHRLFYESHKNKEDWAAMKFVKK